MALPEAVTIRNADPRDHQTIVSVIPEWWGGRDLRASVPKLLLIHFSPTSFIAEENESLAGFLVGFLSQTFPDEAYIHFAGVRPDLRNQGVATALYKKFFQAVSLQSRSTIRSCTAPENKLSIAFHRGMGFSIEPGDDFIGELPVTTGYLQETDKKVIFRLCLKSHVKIRREQAESFNRRPD